jgi:GTP-binding protein Era
MSDLNLPDATPTPDASSDPIATPAGHRSGYATLVGRPNAGKSTLLNALVGQKLAIVTRKPQTTRHRIVGILHGPNHQVVLLDTPGLLQPKYELQKRMMDAVDRALSDADVVLFLADATRPADDEELAAIEGRNAILVLTKMDLIDRDEALPVADAFSKLRDWDAIVPISATRGYNLDYLLEKILEQIPLGPPYYPADAVSEHPERFFVTEIVREKIFEQFRQEVPYSTQVNIVQFEETPERDHIEAEIVVERDSQKGILIGKGGQALKRIGIAARHDIEEMTGRPSFLKLHVKVREDWRKKDVFLNSFGY